MKQILVILLSTFCSVAAAEWSFESQKAMPDGSVIVLQPSYLFEGVSYLVNSDNASAAGVCAILGKPKAVRWSWTGHTAEKWLITLSDNGYIIDTNKGTGYLHSVQCK